VLFRSLTEAEIDGFATAVEEFVLTA